MKSSTTQKAHTMNRKKYLNLTIFFFLLIITISYTPSLLAGGKFGPLNAGFFQWLTQCANDAKDGLCQLVETAESVPLQLLFVFLLGILMSLTPCIYPMIPITIGVLQANGSKTFWSHFMLAISYTLGMALTFATFGFIAALSGNVFGQLLTSPLFVIALVLMLAYLALSMFGLYEMKVPRFLGQQNEQKGGSPLSAFMFGAASGTVASPCLSPGLALVLSMVATMGNKLLGFLMLFLFGIGTSLPLLIIGTFSGAINKLPQAGAWMLEVKKIFGFMLLSMCLYYLNNILPSYVTLALMAALCLLGGIYYFIDIKEYDSDTLKKVKNILGFLFILSSGLIAWQSFKAWATPIKLQDEHLFSTNYEEAVSQALDENKNLFIDFGAYYCTSCKYIEKNILNTSPVLNELDRFVSVYVDGSLVDKEPFKTLKETYNIIGFPTMLLIDPKTGELIKKWGSELANTTPEEFADKLKKY